jgi:hypothetical protein
MGNFAIGHDCFYIDGDSQTLTVVSAGGATVSTTVFAAQPKHFKPWRLAASLQHPVCE